MGALATSQGTEIYRQPGLRGALTARRGWLGLAALLVVYELACPSGETLSEGADRALEAHRWLTLGAIGITALHLSNALPARIDPFHRALELIKAPAL